MINYTGTCSNLTLKDVIASGSFTAKEIEEASHTFCKIGGLVPKIELDSPDKVVGKDEILDGLLDTIPDGHYSFKFYRRLSYASALLGFAFYETYLTNFFFSEIIINLIKSI